MHGIGFSFRIYIYRWKHEKNVIIFGADISSPAHIDKGNDILILGEGPSQGLDDAILIAEAIYPFNKSIQNNCLK